MILLGNAQAGATVHHGCYPEHRAALVIDLVPANQFGTGLSLFNSTNWIGLIISSALSGAAIQRLGITPALVIAALLALLVIVLIIPFRWKGAVVTSAMAAAADIRADGSI